MSDPAEENHQHPRYHHPSRFRRDRGISGAKEKHAVAAREGHVEKTIHRDEVGDKIDVQATALVLSVVKPMSLKELVGEIQQRGCRPNDKIRSLTNSVRIGFKYHTDRFRLNGDGKWELVAAR